MKEARRERDLVHPDSLTRPSRPAGRLFETVLDSAFGQVVRGDLNLNPVSGQDTNMVGAHLAGGTFVAQPAIDRQRGRDVATNVMRVGEYHQPLRRIAN